MRLRCFAPGAVRFLIGASAVLGLVVGGSGTASAAPVVLDGAVLCTRSSGRAQKTAWALTENGYVGTYVRLARPGTVAVRVRVTSFPAIRAIPPAPGNPRRMAIAIHDRRATFDIAHGDQVYPHAFVLPAGTHFVRVDLLNASVDGPLAVVSLSIDGAAVSNEATDENAFAAADSYIASGRRGPARLWIRGVEPGTPVRVRLRRHAFHFGVNVPGTSNRFLIEGAAPDSEAGRWQRFVVGHFNTVTPSNGGMWIYNEGVRDFVTMEYPDLIMRWAARHDLFVRMHPLIWDTEQQPFWVQALLTAASNGDGPARAELMRAIDRRVQYYVRDRADGFIEVDVLNESMHHPRYADLLGNQGVAELFNKVARAGGGRVRGFLNEYNVLQGSRVLASEKGKTRAQERDADPFANWYRRHVEAVRAAGGDVGGIGVQYYAIGKTGKTRAPTVAASDPHSPRRIHDVLHNLAAAGLPLALTEFGVQKGARPDDAARILEDTMRIVFGTPGANCFLMFGFWAGSVSDLAPEAVLVDKDWNLTEAGQRYEQLMTAWSTDVSTTMGADGSVDLTGFFGDYVVEADGKAGKKPARFQLVKGTRAYTVSLD